ncbi:hypothetical protein [Ketobacter sp.]|uniref:hypothetical protein n=1 Tax=Ketobacter sp. TaxID=2083498 RepID=UPI0025BDE62E|nr:hypothetical protein [Ketobacter sp.]
MKHTVVLSTLFRSKFIRLLPLLMVAGGYSTVAQAACDCGSTDESKPCTGNSINVSVTDSRTVSFNWSFNSGGSNAFCGQFANGDYWIAPASGKSSVTVTALTASGSGPVALDVNPQLEAMGLLDSSDTYGNYVASENIRGKLPATYSKAVSLVAATERNESAHGECGTKQIVGNCADVYNVVTVLTAPPKNNGAYTLRPNIDDDVKDLITFDDIDFSRLPSKSYLQGTDADGLEAIRQRWSHSTEVLSVRGYDGSLYSEGGRAFRASLLVPDYGGGVAKVWHDDLMKLFSSDNTLEEKKPALAAMLVYGKDLFHAMYDGSTRTRNWGSGAGQSLGKFPTAVFFAAMMKDTFYADVLSKTSTTLLGYDDLRGPHELDQVNIGKNGPIWGDYPDDMSETDIGAYWASALKSQCFDGATGSCNPNVGKKTSRDPYGYIDGPPNNPGTSYMSVSLGPMRSMVATMFLLPKMCDIVNYQPLVEYVDRVHKDGIKASDDPCAPPDPRESVSGCDAYRGGDGCRYYGVTWGPDPSNPGMCITNGAGQNGRFPDRDGDRLNPGYPSSQVEDNWERIRGSQPTCLSANLPMPPNTINVQQTN